MALPAPLLERLAQCAAIPWSVGSTAAEPGSLGHASVIEELRAALPRGQPMPAGVLLDSPAILARFPTLASRLGMLAPVGYHPRFGLFVANGLGKCQRVPIRRPTAAWSDHDVAFEAPLPFAQNWADWLAALIAIEDVLRCEYVVWARTGSDEATVALWAPGEGAWSELAWATSSTRRERVRRVLERLEAKPLDASGAHASDGALIHDFETELLVGCRSDADLARVLEVAKEDALLVLPHAWGGDRLYSARGPETERPLYELEPTRGERLTIGPLAGAPVVWTRSSGTNVIRQRHIPPRRSLASRPAILDGASPRLLRYLARRGAIQVDALRSVEGTREWLRELGARDWSVLERIEEEAGGILLQPAWALEPPERIGPWIMHEDRESLATVGLAESEDDPPAPAQPWPFVTTHGMQLAVVGLLYARFENALCADICGWIYELDHEFGTLSPLAETMLGFFEKRAFRAEQFGDGFGLAQQPAAVVPLPLAPALLHDLGLSRVEEASDAISSQHISATAWVDRCAQHTCRDARTWFYSADHDFIVRAARLIRSAHPELPIQFRIGVDPVSAARRAAFDAASIPGTVPMDWWEWGQFNTAPA